MSLNKNCEEQKQAILKAQNGDTEILERLMFDNKAMVLNRIYALGFTQKSKDFEDMYQEGMIGLYTAIMKFDLSKGTAFSTFAYDWIEQRIKRTKSNKAITDIPEYLKTKLSKYKKAFVELQNELGVSPTIDELAEELNTTKEEIMKFQQLLNMTTISLNDYKYSDSDEERTSYTEVGDTVSLATEDTMYSNFEEKNFKLVILSLIFNSNLTDEEIIILLLHFNLIFKTKYTLEELADRLGYNKETIRFKENSALKKLIDNPNILYLLNHSQNPDLVLRKIKIRTSLMNKTLLTDYPYFNSLFPEYSDEEIEKIYEELNLYDKKFLGEISIEEDGKLKFINHTKRDADKLFKIISDMYEGLLNEFGRRRPIDYDESSYDINLTFIPSNKLIQEKLESILDKLDAITNAPKLTEEHNFYDLFLNIPKELINISLDYISDTQYEFLNLKYGANLLGKCNGDNNKLSSGEVLTLRTIIDNIKKNVETIQNGNKLFSNIYTYFDNYSITLIDKVINELSDTDKALLHKRFGPNFKEQNQLLTRLTNDEIARLKLIIKKLDKNLADLSTLEFIDYDLNTPRSIYASFNRYDKDLIAYAVTKLREDGRNFLKSMFGSNLDLSFETLKTMNFKPEDLDRYKKSIRNSIVAFLKRIDERGIDALLEKEAKNLNLPNNTIKFGISGIYRLFSYVSSEKLDIAINSLFDDEIIRLKSIFGEDLKSDCFYLNIINYSKEKRLAIYGIINKIHKNLTKEQNKDITISEYNTILNFIKNSNIKALSSDEIKDNMILFLSLGIGGVEPVSNKVIASSFNITEIEVKEIIVKTLKKYKENLTGFSHLEYCPITDSTNLTNNMIFFSGLGMGTIKPIPNKVISKTFGLNKKQLNRMIEIELKSANDRFVSVKTNFDRLISMYEENTDNDIPVIKRYIKSK